MPRAGGRSRATTPAPAEPLGHPLARALALPSTEQARERLALLAAWLLLYASLTLGALQLGDLLSPTFRAARAFWAPKSVRGYAVPGPFSTWQLPAPPPDPWGQPWVEGPPPRSAGPNRVDEGGAGDDVVLSAQPLLPCYPFTYAFFLPPLCWWAVAFCLALGHLLRGEVEGRGRRLELLGSCLGAALALACLGRLLNGRLWFQTMLSSGWVGPTPGQLSAILDHEFSQGDHVLPALGLERSRAPYTLGLSLLVLLALWIECAALALRAGRAKLRGRRLAQGAATR